MNILVVVEVVSVVAVVLVVVGTADGVMTTIPVVVKFATGIIVLRGYEHD